MLGIKRWMSILLAVAILIGMIPPVYVQAEETELSEVMEATTAPLEEPAISTVETSELPEESEEPAEETTAPTEEPTEPVEETIAPSELPEEETVAPTEETTAPTEETTVATEEATAPTDEAVEPTEETTIPTEAATEPSEETTAPTEETVATEPETTDSTEETFGLNASEEAAGAVAASGTSGKLKWSLSTDGVLTISGSGAMNDYSMSSLPPWHEYSDSIQKVVISKGVTSIGKMAFMNCEMNFVTIAEGVTAIKDSAFNSCPNLLSVAIPASVKTIGSNVFTGCGALSSITVNPSNSSFSSADGVLFNKAKTTLIRFPTLKGGAYTVPSTVTTIGHGAFYGCGDLTSISLPSGLKEVKDNAFFWCHSLTSITFPSNVTSMGKRALSGCENLKSVSLPSNLTQIPESLLSGCRALTSVTLPAKVTSIETYAFQFCASLKTVTLPSSLTSIGTAAFGECMAMNAVSLPAKLSSIGQMAFRNCTALSSITIPASVSDISADPFMGCTKLKTITVSGDNKKFASVDGILYNKSKTELICCPLGRTADVTVPEGVKTIKTKAFDGCVNLKKVVLPTTLTKLEDRAMAGMSGLEEVVFTGDCPQFGASALDGLGGKIGYPHNNSTWSYQKLVGILGEIAQKLVAVAIDIFDNILGIHEFTYDENTADKALAKTMVEYALLAYQDSVKNSSGKWTLGNNSAAIGYALDRDGFRELQSFYYKDADNQYVTRKLRDQANEDTSPFTIGHRKVRDKDGKVVDQIAVVFMGSYEKDWYGDFDVTGTSYNSSINTHYSFQKSVESALSLMASYIKTDATGINSQNVQVVITGHSRGAAVANLMAHALNEIKAGRLTNADLSGITFSRIYAYTFATPNVASVSKIQSCTEEKNIHNYCFTDDFVPNLPMENWSWGKYGKTYWAKAESLAASSTAFVSGVKTHQGKTPKYNSAYTRTIVTTILEAEETCKSYAGLEHYYKQAYYRGSVQTTLYSFIRGGLGGAMQKNLIEAASGGLILASALDNVSSPCLKTLADTLVKGADYLTYTHSCASYFSAINNCFGSFQYDKLTSTGYSKTDYALSAVAVDPSVCKPDQVAAINAILKQSITMDGVTLSNGDLLGWEADDVAHWRKVEWDENGNVVALNMRCTSVLGELDLSAFPELRTVNLDYCYVSSLNLSGCSKLTELVCNANWLTELDLSECVSLKKLECARNALIQLNLSGCSALESLDCSGNELYQLDLSNCQSLTDLDCTENYLDPSDALLVQKAEAIRNAGGHANYMSQKASAGASFAQNDLNRLLAIANSGSNQEILNWDLADPSSWTQVTWVRDGASFHLETVDLTDLDLAGEAIFDGCAHLTSLKISNNKFTQLSVNGCDALEILWCSWNYLEEAQLAELTVDNLKIDSQQADILLNEADVAALDALSAEKKLYWDPKLYGTNDILIWTEGAGGIYNLTGMDLTDADITGLLDLTGFDNLKSVSARNVRIDTLILPDCVTEIPEEAFAGSVALAQVVFTGDAPAIAETAFTNLALTCCYPYGNETWTQDLRMGYGGSLVWKLDPDTMPPQATALWLLDDAGEEVGKNTIWFDMNSAAESMTFFVKTLPEEAMDSVSLEYDRYLADVVQNPDGSITVTPTGNRGTMTLTVKTVDGTDLTAKVSIRFAALEFTQDEIQGEDPADIQLISSKYRTLKVYEGGKALTSKQIKWSVPAEYAPYASITAAGKLTAKKVVEKVRIEAIGRIIGSERTAVTVKVDIYPAATQVELYQPSENGESMQLVNGKSIPVEEATGSLTLTTGLFPTDALQKVTWTISDKKNAYAVYEKTDTSLTISGIKSKAGTVTIKATAADGSKKSATVKLVFGTLADRVTIGYKSGKKMIEAEEYDLLGGKSVQLAASVTCDEGKTPSNKKVTWSITEGSEYAKISSSGKVTAKKVYETQEVTVKAVAADGSGKADTFTVHVIPAKTGQLVLKRPGKDADGKDILINVTGTTIIADTTAEITLSAWNQDGNAPTENVTWKSSSKYAVVEGGTVTFTKAGTRTITATAGKRTAKVTFVVSDLADDVIITSKNLKVASGKSLTLSAYAEAAQNKKVTWSIVDGDAYAKITSSGKLTAVKNLTAQHEVKVRAIAADGSGKCADAVVTVYPLAQGVQVYSEQGERTLFSLRSDANWWVRSNTTLQWNLTTQSACINLNAYVYPYYGEGDKKTAIQDVTWKSSSTKIADFEKNEDGSVKIENGNVQLNCKNAGTVTITATAGDGSKQKVSFKLKIVKTVTKLSLADRAVKSGKSVSLAKYVVFEPTDATNKKLSWEITSGGEFATISSGGTFKAKKVKTPQVVEVTVTAQDGNDKFATCKITINP